MRIPLRVKASLAVISSASTLRNSATSGVHAGAPTRRWGRRWPSYAPGGDADGDDVGAGVGEDVDSPEMSTPEGEPAKVFATDTLLGQRVWLDIDDKSKDGRDPYGRLIAVVYLEDLNGTINTTHPFNRLLVDAGHAIVKDFTNNEFDPATWWEEEIPQPELSPAPDTATTAKGGQFVGSVRSDKYHYPSCKWGETIASHNEIWFSSSEEARAAGYVPCGACRPP